MNKKIPRKKLQVKIKLQDVEILLLETNTFIETLPNGLQHHLLAYKKNGYFAK